MANEAVKPNPALKPFIPFIGTWKTSGTHPMVPGKTFRGKTTVEWLEGGAFLMLHSEIDEPEIPSAVSIFGSDDVANKFFMLYFDERGISRKYDVSFDGSVMHCSRETPEFSQRMIFAFSADGKSIVNKGEMSKNGAPWEPDLELTYTRVE